MEKAWSHWSDTKFHETQLKCASAQQQFSCYTRDQIFLQVQTQITEVWRRSTTLSQRQLLLRSCVGGSCSLHTVRCSCMQTQLSTTAMTPHPHLPCRETDARCRSSQIPCSWKRRYVRCTVCPLLITPFCIVLFISSFMPFSLLRWTDIVVCGLENRKLPISWFPLIGCFAGFRHYRSKIQSCCRCIAKMLWAMRLFEKC